MIAGRIPSTGGVAAALIALSACGSAERDGSSPSPYACVASDSAQDTRLADSIDCVVDVIKTRHPNAFTVISETTFDRLVDSLRSRMDALPPDSGGLELAKLAAAIGDAHTRVAFLDADERFLPLHVYWFGTELYVVRATEEFEHLIGSRIVRLGGLPVDELLSRVEEVIAHELRSWVLEKSTTFLMSALVLNRVGATAPADVAVDLVDTQSNPAQLTLPTVRQSTWWGISERSDTLPLHRRFTTHNYWYERVSSQNLVYLAYNKAIQDPAESFGTMTERLMTELQPSDRLVIDLRRNTGGNSIIFRPMLNAIRSRSWLNQADRLFVVIGRGTFSAGVSNAYQLAEQTRATFVGEGLGQPRATFGEVRSFVLPLNQAQMFYSTDRFEDGSETLLPDVSAPPNARDFFENRDPALAAILDP